MKWPPSSAANRRDSLEMAPGSSAQWHFPPCHSISSTFSRLVDCGTTAMNGSPSMRAKYASETAVEPEEASMTGVFLVTQPLQIACRNRDLANRCFKEPVGCVDSSLR